MLFLHPHVVIILIVRIYNILVNIPYQSNVEVDFRITLTQRLEGDLTQVNVTAIDDLDKLIHVDLLSLKLTLIGLLNQLGYPVVHQHFLLIFPIHVALQYFGTNLLLEDSSEFGHRNLVLGNEVLQERLDLIDVYILEVILRQCPIRKWYPLHL